MSSNNKSNDFTFDNAQSEIDYHLAVLRDRDLSDAELARLNELVAESTENTDYYIRRMYLAANLEWDLAAIGEKAGVRGQETGIKRQESGGSSTMGFQPVEGHESGERKAEESATDLSPVTTHYSLLHNWSRFLTQHKLGTGIAAGLLFVVMLIGWAAMTYLPNVAQDDQPEEETPIEWIALLNHAHEAEWLDGTEPPAHRPRLKLGQRLAISAGVLEINYRTGARVIVEGPAEFTVGDQATGRQEGNSQRQPAGRGENNSGYLALGKLVARVEGKRAQGFVIETPSVRIEDLGTEFGVDVDRKGTADVAVIEGAIDLVRDSGNERVRLIKGQGALVQTSGTPITRRGMVDPQQFAVLARRASKTFDSATIRVRTDQTNSHADYQTSVSSRDLINGIEGTHSSRHTLFGPTPNFLTNGVFSAGEKRTGEQVTYDSDGWTSIYELGAAQDIDKIITYSGWESRDNWGQNYTVDVRYDGKANFVPLTGAIVNFQPTQKWQRVTIQDDSGYPIATQVVAIRFNFGKAISNQQMISEIDVFRKN